jgi:large subunit ribosomal protein L29
MKPSEIRGLTTAELKRKLEESREELMNLRFQMSTGSLKDFTRLEQTRRTIARLITIIDEKLASENEGVA